MPESKSQSLRYLAKLRSRVPLSPAAESAFLDLDCRIEQFAPRRDIVRQGEQVNRCHLIATGIVSQYKIFSSGERQILSFHMPNEIIGLQSCLMGVTEYGLRAQSQTQTISFVSADILRVTSQFPALGTAFWYETLAEAAISREWIASVGRRSTRSRVIHLLLGFAYRLEAVGLSNAFQFTLPVTQVDMADALGVSPVHVNRTLQALRSEHLIRSHGRTIFIEDPVALARESHFDTAYLHPEGSTANLSLV